MWLKNRFEKKATQLSVKIRKPYALQKNKTIDKKGNWNGYKHTGLSKLV